MSKTSAVTIFFTSRLGLSSLQKLLDCSKKKREKHHKLPMAMHPKPSYFPPPCFFTGSWQYQAFQRIIFISTDITFEKPKQMCFSISSSTGYFVQTDWYFRLLCMYSYGLLLSILLFPQVYFYKTTSVMQTLTYKQQLCERPHFS